MPVDNCYQPDRSIKAKLLRRATQWRTAAPFNIRPARPTLSLSFDDCPETAISIGGKILDDHQIPGCFYISTGMLGKDSPMGRIAHDSDIVAAHASGHEIGAHTHSHIDMAQTDMPSVLQDIERNLSELSDILKGDTVTSFAFPYGETTFELKAHLSKQFRSMRGVLPGRHRGLVDRAQLRAYEIDGSEMSLNRMLNALDDAAQSPAWIFLFTHDVSETPSPFGITPDQLQLVIRRAKELEFDFATPSSVMEQYGEVA